MTGRKQLILLLGSLAAALVLSASLVHAENLGPGGGWRVAVGDQVVGPYRLLVTTSPEPAQVGQLTIAVRITDPATGDFIRDARVAIRLVDPETGDTLNAAATHENAGNAVDYASHIQVPAAGVWRATVAVDGVQGKAEVGFDQRVLTPRSASTVLLVGIPFLLALTAAAGIWYFRSGARPAPAT